jgi:glycosyltransferase involved in cell wall biosynthesis
MVESATRLRRTGRPRPDDERITIGYFSGTPRVHEEDLANIAPALCAVLDQHSDVALRIYGGVRLRGALAEPCYAARIEQRPAVSWNELPGHIAQVDLTIAPLVDNPQRRAKSAVKYMEAALLDVPTVAARLDPYADAIAHGVTGLLAATTDEWICSLTQLIRSPELRRRLGAAARDDVLGRHTTAMRAPQFAATLAQVLE